MVRRTAPPALIAILVSVASVCILAPNGRRTKKEEDATRPAAVIWREQRDVASLSLFYGAGGKRHAPDPHEEYFFVREDLNGRSPKFDIVDSHGVEWRAKLGEEAQPEVAATRLLWAAGYFVDEDYYLQGIKVIGLPELHRGNQYVSPDGTVRGARLERRLEGVKKLGNWDWFNNPFLGTRELNGLRVMMSLVNNWDLSAANNAIYLVGTERRFLVSDVGATFGETGNYFTRSKGNLTDYARSDFIRRVTTDYVDFEMRSRPFFLSVLDPPVYRERTRMEAITRHIPCADAKWLGQRLSRLSRRQIRECFRAAGYTAEEVDGYTNAIRRRIADLKAL
jgi:hypothetical protein